MPNLRNQLIFENSKPGKRIRESNQNILFYAKNENQNLKGKGVYRSHKGNIIKKKKIILMIN